MIWQQHDQQQHDHEQIEQQNEEPQGDQYNSFHGRYNEY